MSTETSELHPFVAAFLASEAVGDDSFAERRRVARARLPEIGVPTPRHEEWRFVKLRPLLGAAFGHGARAGALTAEQVDALLLEETADSRLVFVDGARAAEHSRTTALPDGVAAGGFDELDEAQQGAVVDALGHVADFYRDDLFLTLNDATFGDVACVVVPPNTKVEAPLHLLYAQTGDAAVQARVVVVVGRGSELTLVEDYVGVEGATGFTNAVTEVVVADDARVQHVRIQREAEASFHIARVAARLHRSAHYDSVAVNFGARVSRSDVYVQHAGEGAWARIDGLTLIGGEQASDTHSVIDNQRQHCQSHQLHKCVVGGRGHAVFNGKIFVREGAQRISAYQLNRNLLLSNEARVDTKPQLEIFADDVECSHGATVGQLDEDQAFYLVSRGVTPERARAILTYAFAAEVIEAVHVPSLQRRLEAMASDRTLHAEL